MFRILTPSIAEPYSDPGPSKQSKSKADLDSIMIDNFIAENDPTQAAGGGGASSSSSKVTGPGEVIADATRWMR